MASVTALRTRSRGWDDVRIAEVTVREPVCATRIRSQHPVFVNELSRRFSCAPRKEWRLSARDVGPGYRVYFAREGRMTYLLLRGVAESEIFALRTRRA